MIETNKQIFCKLDNWTNWTHRTTALIIPTHQQVQGRTGRTPQRRATNCRNSGYQSNCPMRSDRKFAGKQDCGQCPSGCQQLELEIGVVPFASTSRLQLGLVGFISRQGIPGEL